MFCIGKCHTHLRRRCAALCHMRSSTLRAWCAWKESAFSPCRMACPTNSRHACQQVCACVQANAQGELASKIGQTIRAFSKLKPDTVGQEHDSNKGQLGLATLYLINETCFTLFVTAA